MRSSGNKLGDLVGRVMVAQSAILVIASAGIGLFSGLQGAAAVAFGSVIGILLTWITARSVRRSSTAVLRHPGKAMLPLYSGLVQKLLIGGGGIVFGFTVLQLDPLFIVLGFGLSQLGFMAALLNPEN